MPASLAVPRLGFRQITPCLSARSAALLSGTTPSTWAAGSGPRGRQAVVAGAPSVAGFEGPNDNNENSLDMLPHQEISPTISPQGPARAADKPVSPGWRFGVLFASALRDPCAQPSVATHRRVVAPIDVPEEFDQLRVDGGGGAGVSRFNRVDDHVDLGGGASFAGLPGRAAEDGRVSRDRFWACYSGTL
jgi:hypothetical protein